jgi:hypothetical protein
MSYKGETCEQGYRNLWKPVRTGQPDLAELMKIDTVVVDLSLVTPVSTPRGWHESRRTNRVVLLQPDSAYRWPDSRLSWVSRGTTVESAVSTSPTREVVVLGQTGATPTKLVFARLGWPGYEAELDGSPVEVSRDPAGLLEVHLPAGVEPGTLVVTFRPPGFGVGLTLAGLSLLGAAALAAGPRLHRRRPGPSADPGSAGQ